MTIKNYYKLLSIDSKSNLNEIKKAFRNQIAIYHPEINTSKDAEKHFDDLVEAFDILSKPDKRKLYDTLLNTNDTNSSYNAIANSKKKETFNEWRKEAKKKSIEYKKKNQDDSLDLDIFSELLIEGLLKGAWSFIEGTGEILGDLLDGF